MAQSRNELNDRTSELADPMIPNPAPLPIPTETEGLSLLKEELHYLMDAFSDEDSKLKNLEVEILSEGDINFESNDALTEDSYWESMYEKIAPWFVSAHQYLAHILENERYISRSEQLSLHALLTEGFDHLTPREKEERLLHICVISVALVHDMRILINKYNGALDQYINRDLFIDAAWELGINGTLTILVDMSPYHPDHAKQLVEHRQDLYTSLGVVDVKIQDFLNIMRGHIEAAIHFVKENKSKLKTELKEMPKEEPKQAPDTVKRSISQTLLAPPISSPVPAVPAELKAADPVEPPRRGGCALL